jgi:hypothetical protein
MRHIPEKHQSIFPTGGTVLALSIEALILLTIFFAVALADHRF